MLPILSADDPQLLCIDYFFHTKFKQGAVGFNGLRSGNAQPGL
jgi:hypothetical protein